MKSRKKPKQKIIKLTNSIREQSLTAIGSAFGLLVALSWREPISEFVDLIISRLNLDDGAIYYKFLSAFIITFIAVLGFVFIAKLKVKKKK